LGVTVSGVTVLGVTVSGHIVAGNLPNIRSTHRRIIRDPELIPIRFRFAFSLSPI